MVDLRCSNQFISEVFIDYFCFALEFEIAPPLPTLPVREPSSPKIMKNFTLNLLING